MPIVKPPYPGQGTVLPESTGLKGQWIIENIAALTIGEPSTPDEDGVFQRTPKSPNGNNIYTVDAPTLAAQFNLTLKDLLTENQNGRLFLGFEEIGAKIARLKFNCRGTETVVDFERFDMQ